MEKQTTKLEKIAAILFLIIGALTAAEYVLIQGMFTAPLMIALSILTGLVNIIVAAAKRKYINALVYALLTIALNMGYFML